MDTEPSLSHLKFQVADYVDAQGKHRQCFSAAALGMDALHRLPVRTLTRRMKLRVHGFRRMMRPTFVSALTSGGTTCQIT